MAATEAPMQAVPLFVFEFLSPGTSLPNKSVLPFLGGLHPSRLGIIKTVVVVEPSESQVLIAQNLDVTCHYMIYAADKDLFLTHCKKLKSFETVFVSAKESLTGDRYPIQIFNTGTAEWTDELCAQYQWLQMQKIASDLWHVAPSLRGNIQQSIGTTSIDWHIPDGGHIAFPQQRKIRHTSDVTRLPIMTELYQDLGYKIGTSMPQDEVRRTHFANELGEKNGFEGMTVGLTKCYSGTSATGLCRSHVDQNNDHREGYDKTVIVSQCGKHDGCMYRSVCIAYHKAICGLMVLKENWMSVLFSKAQQFVESADPNRKTAALAFHHACNMKCAQVVSVLATFDKYVYLSPIINVILYVAQQLGIGNITWQRLVEMLLPVAWVNSANRYVEGFMLLLNSTHMPSHCWTVAFIDVLRQTFGSVTGGRDCRLQSGFNKGVSWFVVKSSLLHLSDILRELNDDCPVGCSEAQLDKGFQKAVVNMKDQVHHCKELTAMHILHVAVGVGAIVNPKIGTKALIAPGTMTFKKTLLFLESSCSTEVFNHAKSFLKTHDGRRQLLNGVKRSLGVSEAVAENIFCKMFLDKTLRYDTIYCDQSVYFISGDNVMFISKQHASPQVHIRKVWPSDSSYKLACKFSLSSRDTTIISKKKCRNVVIDVTMGIEEFRTFEQADQSKLWGFFSTHRKALLKPHLSKEQIEIYIQSRRTSRSTTKQSGSDLGDDTDTSTTVSKLSAKRKKTVSFREDMSTLRYIFEDKSSSMLNTEESDYVFNKYNMRPTIWSPRIPDLSKENSTVNTFRPSKVTKHPLLVNFQQINEQWNEPGIPTGRQNSVRSVMTQLNKSFTIDTKFCMDECLNISEISLRTHSTKVYVAVLSVGKNLCFDYRQLTRSACLFPENSIVIRDGCLFFNNKEDAKDAFLWQLFLYGHDGIKRPKGRLRIPSFIEDKYKSRAINLNGMRACEAIVLNRGTFDKRYKIGIVWDGQYPIYVSENENGTDRMLPPLKQKK